MIIFLTILFYNNYLMCRIAGQLSVFSIRELKILYSWLPILKLNNGQVESLSFLFCNIIL